MTAWRGVMHIYGNVVLYKTVLPCPTSQCEDQGDNNTHNALLMSLRFVGESHQHTRGLALSAESNLSFSRPSPRETGYFILRKTEPHCTYRRESFGRFKG